jgi:hypothetical protein
LVLTGSSKEAIMTIPWSSERASLKGLAEFLGAAALLVAGVAVTRWWAPTEYQSLESMRRVFSGLVAFALSGLIAYRIVRRREYPWILGLAAVGLAFYEPIPGAFGGSVFWRSTISVRDLALVGAAAYYLVRTMRSVDELERRVQLEALSASYAVVLVALIAYALAEDVLPPLRGPWVASALLGSFVVAWVVASTRYQR